MVPKKIIEISVGFFLLISLLALIGLAFKVSGLTQVGDGEYYRLVANFDNIGSLKVRSPVSISGVKIGRIEKIQLDKDSFRAQVIMRVNKNFNQIPMDTSASILTQGLLGSNYIALTPGVDAQILKNGGEVATTHSALILENLIGQLLFHLNSKSSADSDKNKEAKEGN